MRSSMPLRRSFIRRSTASLCLPIVGLILTACAASPQPLQPLTPPPLESTLAQPCPPIPEPLESSYDAWQEWVQDTVLKAYADCRARHAATVNAWPK